MVLWREVKTLHRGQIFGPNFFTVKSMPSFRQNRSLILLAHGAGFLDDEEFVLLYDMNTSKNPDLPYWNYGAFDLDLLTDAECKTEFRFHKQDIYNLADVLNIPDKITCYNGIKVDSVKARCIFLKRFAQPCRYSNMIPRFGRAVPQFSIISTRIMNLNYNQWHHLLNDFRQPWLTLVNLQRYAYHIHKKGATLQNCWGFRWYCTTGQSPWKEPASFM